MPVFRTVALKAFPNVPSGSAWAKSAAWPRTDCTALAQPSKTSPVRKRSDNHTVPAVFSLHIERLDAPARPGDRAASLKNDAIRLEITEGGTPISSEARHFSSGSRVLNPHCDPEQRDTDGLSECSKMVASREMYAFSWMQGSMIARGGFFRCKNGGDLSAAE